MGYKNQEMVVFIKIVLKKNIEATAIKPCFLINSYKFFLIMKQKQWLSFIFKVSGVICFTINQS